MSRSARMKREDVDDGLRAAHDAYQSDPLVPFADPLMVRRDAYKGDALLPVRSAASYPLRRCPGCQARDAQVSGFLPPRRPCYVCRSCRRRFVVADVD